MVSAIAIVLVAVPLYFAYSIYSGFQANIRAAKLSGLPYIIVPFYLFSPVWLITHRLWLPLLHMLPKAWIEPWIRSLSYPDWCWMELYDAHMEFGDTFIAVSLSRNIVWTAEPEVIHQVTQRRDDFPKPLESYGVLNIYGRNMVSTEGTEWKKHRKITSPSFNEKNNALVFRESIAQAQGMLRKWLGSKGDGNHTLNEVPLDSMRMTLHIISKIGFGVGLLWPGEQPNEKDAGNGINFSSNKPPKGFTMSFEQALSTVLDNLMWVLILPGWLLRRIPISSAQEAYESYFNWGKYMKTIYEEKVAEARAGEHREGMDIMGSLARSTINAQDSKSTETGRVGQAALSESEVLGNAFVLLLAGHETTANSLHFGLVMLAMNPPSQRRLQRDIQMIFGDTQPENWDYETSINKVLGGMIGAVLNEQLRLMPPVINIPKSVRPDLDQVIVVKGKKILMPKGAFVALNTIGAHRNPKYWPSRGLSKISGRSNDLDDFSPERWLVGDGSRADVNAPEDSESDRDDFGGFTGESSAAQLFRPARGSYLPFSDGARSCLGRRLAQVEVVTVLAVIFQKYSIELAVDEWATDDQVAKMSNEEKIAVYEKARQKAESVIKGASTRITLKLHEGITFIPVRAVRKGEERFISLIEQ